MVQNNPDKEQIRNFLEPKTERELLMEVATDIKYLDAQLSAMQGHCYETTKGFSETLGEHSTKLAKHCQTFNIIGGISKGVITILFGGGVVSAIILWALGIIG